MGRRAGQLRSLVVAIAFLSVASVVRSELMTTNSAGVRAGIAGIVRVLPNSVNVRWSVVDPTGTNVTSFKIQRSPDLAGWTDYTMSTQMVTGSSSGSVSDFTTSTNQFYRMDLINFH